MANFQNFVSVHFRSLLSRFDSQNQDLNLFQSHVPYKSEEDYNKIAQQRFESVEQQYNAVSIVGDSFSQAHFLSICYWALLVGGIINILVIICLLRKLNIGDYKKKLQYKRNVVEIMQGDRVVKCEIAILILAQFDKVAYLGLALYVLRTRIYEPEEDYNEATDFVKVVQIMQLLFLFLLWIMLAIEVRQWLLMSVRLHSANYMIGVHAYKGALNVKLEIYIVSAVLGGVLWCIYLILDASSGNSRSQHPIEPEPQPPLNSTERQDEVIEAYTKSSTAVSAGIFFVYLLPAFGLALFGYQLHERSSIKYKHEVEIMRKNILHVSLAMITACLLVAIIYGFQAILADSITQWIDEASSPGQQYQIYMGITTFLGDLLPVLIVTLSLYSRLCNGWDRIYLLPLNQPEQNILLDLQQAIKDNEIDVSLIDKLDLFPDNEHFIARPSERASEIFSVRDQNYWDNNSFDMGAQESQLFENRNSIGIGYPQLSPPVNASNIVSSLPQANQMMPQSLGPLGQHLTNAGQIIGNNNQMRTPARQSESIIGQATPSNNVSSLRQTPNGLIETNGPQAVANVGNLLGIDANDVQNIMRRLSMKKRRYEFAMNQESGVVMQPERHTEVAKNEREASKLLLSEESIQNQGDQMGMDLLNIPAGVIGASQKNASGSVKRQSRMRIFSNYTEQAGLAQEPTSNVTNSMISSIPEHVNSPILSRELSAGQQEIQPQSYINTQDNSGFNNTIADQSQSTFVMNQQTFNGESNSQQRYLMLKSMDQPAELSPPNQSFSPTNNHTNI